jgi:hypothetical protein
MAATRPCFGSRMRTALLMLVAVLEQSYPAEISRYLGSTIQPFSARSISWRTRAWSQRTDGRPQSEPSRFPRASRTFVASCRRLRPVSDRQGVATNAVTPARQATVITPENPLADICSAMRRRRLRARNRNTQERRSDVANSFPDPLRARPSRALLSLGRLHCAQRGRRGCFSKHQRYQHGPSAFMVRVRATASVGTQRVDQNLTVAAENAGNRKRSNRRRKRTYCPERDSTPHGLAATDT